MKHECRLQHSFAASDVDAAAGRHANDRVTLHGTTRCIDCHEEGTVKVELAASVVREMKRRAAEADAGYV